MDGVRIEVLLAGWKPSNEARALCESVRGKRGWVGDEISIWSMERTRKVECLL